MNLRHHFTDYEPVSITLASNIAEIAFSIVAKSDDVVEEDEEIILTFVSTITNFVQLVEQRGNIISHTAVVRIIDNTIPCT